MSTKDSNSGLIAIAVAIVVVGLAAAGAFMEVNGKSADGIWWVLGITFIIAVWSLFA